MEVVIIVLFEFDSLELLVLNLGADRLELSGKLLQLFSVVLTSDGASVGSGLTPCLTRFLLLGSLNEDLLLDVLFSLRVVCKSLQLSFVPHLSHTQIEGNQVST